MLKNCHTYLPLEISRSVLFLYSTDMLRKKSPYGAHKGFVLGFGLLEFDEWHEHFFERDAAVLESVAEE